jgi:cysteine synthase A
VRIYMPDWMSRERVLVIQSLGAAVIPVSAELGGFLGSIRMADEFAREAGHVFRPQQFDNPANVQAHYETTGPEITAQLATWAARPRASWPASAPAARSWASRSTCASASGRTSRASARAGELADAAHRAQGRAAPHPGHQRRIRAVHREAAELGRILDVWDGDAIVMSQRLANELGIAVGISSGANLLGALEIAHEQGERACVVTVFCDDNKKYLSTDLCSDEECKEHYQVNDVELLDFRVVAP